MATTIRGWAPDPHDADAPEDEYTCEGCGVETEDLWECDLTRDEARELKMRPMHGNNWLCLSCLSHVERIREEQERRRRISRRMIEQQEGEHDG